MRKRWDDWWLRVEAFVPFIVLLGILAVLLFLAVVLWPRI